jgi:hypothetical protein
MQSSFFQRAAVAIVLMGALLAPFGICLQPAHSATHRCCQQASQKGSTAKQDCCVVRNDAPAVIVLPATAGSGPMVLVSTYLAASEISSPRETTVAALVPTHAPPGRTSILRI